MTRYGNDHRRLDRRRWVLAAGAILLAGCGGDRSLAPVSGRVTWEGTPVETGRIQFFPTEGGRPAFAPIESDGRYTLTTFEQGDGARIGSHQVTITATRTIGGPAAPKTFQDELKIAEGSPAEHRAPTLEWIVPESYSERSTTPLTATVESEGNTIDFELPPGEPGPEE